MSYVDSEDGGEQIRIVDANGNVKEEHQNAAGLTLQTSDLEGNAEETSGIITNYEYDSLGRVVKEIYSDDTYATYIYEGDSERTAVKSEYLADGTVESSTEYTYNGQNNLTRIVHKDGDTIVCEYNYTYDVKGQVLTESVSYGSEETHVTAYEYDNEGRVVKVDHPSGSALGAVSYEYDDWGNLLTIKDDGAILREYTYDGFGRVTAIKDNVKAGSESYTLKSYSYDQLGRTTSMVYTENGNKENVLESYVYSYDKNNNIVSETRISNLPEEGSKINETRGYVYDSYGRLTSSTITDHTVDDAQKVISYEYDAVGNRIKQTEEGVVTTYEYNGLNQLEKAETDTEEVLYTYDARGNQVLENNTTTGESVETTYNVAGEMVQLVRKSGEEIVQTQTNVYNQDGKRTSKEQDETIREYYYNQGVVSYTEDNNSLSTANVQNVDGTVIGTYRGVTYYNYLKNIQGSTSSLISETGDTTVVYSYSDFGETEEVVADTMGNEICYTGAIYDKETGLYYMNARYYDVETGRFISQDTYRGEIENEETWHLYAYCANNPINYVDPSGHIAQVATKSIISSGINNIFMVSTSSIAAIAAICVGSFLVYCGYKMMTNKVKQWTKENVGTTARKQGLTGTYSEEYLEGLAISVARSQKVKRNKDEKHHIVAKKASKAKLSQDILKSVKIDIDSEKNTIMLDYRLHRTLHRNTYYSSVNFLLSRCGKNRIKVINTLRGIKTQLRAADQVVRGM